MGKKNLFRKGLALVLVLMLLFPMLSVNGGTAHAALEDDLLLHYDVNRSFNGVSDYVDVSQDVSQAAGLEQGAIVVKFRTASPAAAKTFISASDTKDPSSNISFTMNGGTVYFENRENEVYATRLSANGAFNDGQWHIAVLSVGPGGTKIYVDALLAGYSSSTAFFTNVTELNGMWIGRNVDNAKAEWFFSGDIEYVQIYKRELTLSEVRQLSGAPDVLIGFTIPFIDLSADYDRQVLTDREPGQYLGHPDSVLLDDGQTILTVYPKGHGIGPIVMKKSTDGGKTWSERLITPPSWETSQETPTIYKIEKPDGSTRLILISGFVRNGETGFQTSYSDDNGETWSEFKPWFYGSGKAGIVAMASLTRLKNPDGSWAHRWMGIFHDYNYNNWKTILSFDENGNEQWSEPERLLAEHDAIEKFAGLCEIEVIRSPDGKQLALLARAQHKRSNAMIAFSNDEGETWTQPREMHGALMGERHKAEYDPVSGRLLITFREIIRRSETDQNDWVAGDWVAWVGTYNDLVHFREGQYRIRLLEDFTPTARSGDTGYAGNVVLEDGTYVLTSYGYFDPKDTSAPYIMTVRLKLEEMDRIAERLKSEDYAQLRKLLTENQFSTWVFTGDEVTLGGMHTAGLRSYVDYFHERVRWEFRHYYNYVINTGTPGLTAAQLLDAFDQKAARFQPAVVSVMLGKNDAAAGLQGLDAFKEDLGKIIDRIRSIGAIPLLQTPVPVPGGGGNLEAYVEALREAADEKQAVLIDHYDHWMNRFDADRIRHDLLNQGAYPNQYGHFEIAMKLFQDMGIYDQGSSTVQLVLPYRTDGVETNRDTEETFRTDTPPTGLSDLENLRKMLSSNEPATWLFTGDSITHGPLHTNGLRNYVEYFHERVRSELGRADDAVINTGISGHRTGDVLGNFDARVANFKPDAVFVMLGMNDVTAGISGRDTFRNHLADIVDRIRDIGAIPVLQTPNPAVGDGSRADLDHYVQLIRQVAADKDVILIDHYAYWNKQKTPEQMRNDWLNDAIHPNQFGHLEMAKKIFADLGIFDEASPTSKLLLAYPLGMVSVENTVQGTGLNQFEFAGSNWGHGVDSYSNQAGSYYQIKFVGTRIKLWGAKDPKHGIAAISIDGGPETEVDLYSPVRQNQYFFTSPELPHGEHTLKVRVTGKKNPSASDTFVVIDRADISDRHFVAHTQAGSGRNQFDYSGSWKSGEVSRSRSQGDKFQFKFNARQIILIGTKGPDHGIAAISIDGGPEQHIDLYSPFRVDGAEYFVSPFLTPGDHTITVRVTGRKHINASDAYVSVSGVELVPHYDPEPQPLSVKLHAPRQVRPEEAFSVQAGLANLRTPVQAIDLILRYDKNLFEFVDAASMSGDVALLAIDAREGGQVRLIAAAAGSEHAIRTEAPFLALTLRARPAEQQSAGLIEVLSALAGDSEGEEMDALTDSVTVEVEPEPIPIVSEDVNGDGKISVGDLAMIAVHYGKDSLDPNWSQIRHLDLDGSGSIDIADLARIARAILESGD